MSVRITFEKEAVEYVLDAFDKTTDDEGYIIDQDDDSRVKTPDGEPLTAEELALIAHGSDIFVDDNYASLIEYIDSRR